MLRNLPVDAAALGLVSVSQPDPLMIWEEKDGRRQLTDRQETNDDGVLLWTAYVMPTQIERPEVLNVRVAAPQQPVLTMLGPVTIDGLIARVGVGKDGKASQYWEASSVRDAGHQGRRNGQHGEQKSEQAA